MFTISGTEYFAFFQVGAWWLNGICHELSKLHWLTISMTLLAEFEDWATLPCGLPWKKD
jgi:hypothetical protein